MFFADDPGEAVRRCAESSRTTHGATEAVDGARYFGALLVGAIRGVDKTELLSERYAPVDGYWDANPLAPKIGAIARGSFKALDPPEIKGSGYVVKSLEAALWAFHRTDNYRDGLLLAVNLGDDADTTGAVYGQIAGAYYGYSGIPEAWRERLVMGDRIVDLAKRLIQAAPEVT
jgi:ADP-ribosylglycohydrolase